MTEVDGAFYDVSALERAIRTHVHWRRLVAILPVLRFEGEMDPAEFLDRSFSRWRSRFFLCFGQSVIGETEPVSDAAPILRARRSGFQREPNEFICGMRAVQIET